MNEAGFNASRWDHWLLIISAMIGLSYALWLSWQWNRQIGRLQYKKMRRRNKRQRDRIAERLGLEISKPEQRNRSKPLSSTSAEGKLIAAEQSRNRFFN